MSEEKKKVERKPREPKKNSVTREGVLAAFHGVETSEKAAWVVLGHRKGTRVVIPKTGGVSRAYFYGAQVPSHPAIRAISPEERKERRMGGITAEVDFSDPSAAMEALAALAAAVRAADVPKARERAEPKPKKAKAVPAEAPAPTTDG